MSLQTLWTFRKRVEGCLHSQKGHQSCFRWRYRKTQQKRISKNDENSSQSTSRVNLAKWHTDQMTKKAANTSTAHSAINEN